MILIVFFFTFFSFQLTNFYSESKALQELFVRVDLIRIM